jgi:hypothetical protein
MERFLLNTAFTMASCVLDNASPILVTIFLPSSKGDKKRDANRFLMQRKRGGPK